MKNDHFGILSNIFYNAGDFNFSSGIHAYTFLRENRESILPHDSNPYYVENSEKREISWFAKADYQIGKLGLFGDLQIRTMKLHIDPDYAFIGSPDEGLITREWTFVNPKLGLNYIPDQRQKVFFSYGFNGREPTKVDLFGGFQLNASNIDFVRSETGFDPEFVHDFEAGYKLDVQKLTVEANLFYMRFKDEIAPIGEIVAFGVQKRQNIPSSTRSGAEVTWNWAATNYLSFHGNAAYLNTSIDEVNIFGDATYSNKRHILSPEWILHENLTIHLTRQLNVTLSHNLMTEQFMELTNDPVFKVPGWTTFDMNAEWLVNDKIRVSLMVNNLIDRQYYTYGAPDFNGNPAFLIQAPRNFYLSTKIRL